MARPKNDGKGRIGGRKKGSVNKVTRERRELIDTFLNEEWEEFKKMYRDLDDHELKLKIYLDLIPYTTPRMASMDYKVKEVPKTFQDELDEDSGEKTRK